MADLMPVLTQKLYDTDFHAWTQEQAALLQAGRWDQVDLINIIEEIESLGRQERRELENRLIILVGHLLKWQYQSDLRSKSWRLTIREQRRQIRKLMQENPSLQPYLRAAMTAAYEGGTILAASETTLELATFPLTCIYWFEQVLDDFLPD